MVGIRDAFPGFSVDDVAAAREFYGSKLGLPVADGTMGEPAGNVISVLAT